VGCVSSCFRTCLHLKTSAPRSLAGVFLQAHARMKETTGRVIRVGFCAGWTVAR